MGQHLGATRRRCLQGRVVVDELGNRRDGRRRCGRGRGGRLRQLFDPLLRILRVLRARVELDDVVVEQERLLVVACQPEGLRGVEQDGRILLQLERLFVLDGGVVLLADGEVRGRLLVVGLGVVRSESRRRRQQKESCRNPDNPTRPRARRALRRQGHLRKGDAVNSIRKRMG